MLIVPLKLNMHGFSVGGHILDANGEPVGHPTIVQEYNALAERVEELEKENQSLRSEYNHLILSMPE